MRAFSSSGWEPVRDSGWITAIWNTESWNGVYGVQWGCKVQQMWACQRDGGGGGRSGFGHLWAGLGSSWYVNELDTMAGVSGRTGFLGPVSCMEEMPCLFRYSSIFSSSIESTGTLRHNFWNSTTAAPRTVKLCMLKVKYYQKFN